ncbi:MAG: GEVED domain-containing protein [Pseudomonadota bacterium]
MSAALAFVAMPAVAQNGPYLYTTPVAVGSGNACTGTPTTFNINIAESFTVTDLNVGIVADHPYRRDIRLEITAPNGTTTVRAINAPASGSGADDLNVLLDSQSGNAQIDNDTTTHDSDFDPYEFTRRPFETLNTFNGLAAQGNWQISLCDTFPNADDGTVDRVQLFFNNIVPSDSDVSLALSVDDSGPDFGDQVTYTVTVNNGGADAVTGLQVSVPLPSGLEFSSSNGGSAYDETTGLWTLPGSIANGGSISLDIVASVLTTGDYTLSAEVSASDSTDPDSTPNNAATAPLEDDNDSLSITPGYSGTPGVAPTLSCTTTAASFDWAASGNNWPVNTNTAATSETRNYPAGGSDGMDFSFSFTGDYVRRSSGSGTLAPYTGTSPTFGTGDTNLIYGQEMNTTSETLTFTANLGTPGIGVEAIQFDVHDIDAGAGNWLDRLDFFGTLNGQTVTPILTQSSANQVIGAAVIGTASANNGTTNGQLVVTFLQPVDSVSFNYRNAETSLGYQVIAIGDLDYCPRPLDYGDAPDSYGDAGHAIRAGYRIGATDPDNETDTQVSSDATADDQTGTNDEDIASGADLTRGTTETLSVPVSGTNGYLQAFIDWDQDGAFDGTDEHVGTDLQASGGTVDVSIAVPVGASLGTALARLRWSTETGLSYDGTASDGEVEDFTVTVSGAAQLDASKSVKLFDPSGSGIYALPGEDVIYTITVSNEGDGPTDVDSIFLVDKIPEEIRFWNGDIDFNGPDDFVGTDPVGVVQSNGAALTYDYATDVRFATGTTRPIDFLTQCSTIAPDGTYRADITFICFRPRGALIGGDPDPEIAFSFRARIE